MTDALLIMQVIAEKVVEFVRAQWVRIALVGILVLMTGGLLLVASRP